MMKTIQPLGSFDPYDGKQDDHAAQSNEPSMNNAADLIRQKVARLYEQEPSAKAELKEVEHLKHKSKHQEFIYKLTTSGNSLADIQTKWHEYYAALPDNEKHEVWQEFYAAHSQQSHHAAYAPQHHTHPTPGKAEHTKAKPAPEKPDAAAKPTPTRTVSEIKQHILKSVGTSSKRINAKQHAKSLVFGLSMGGLVVLTMLFSFFNERVIAPFMTPSRNVSATPIIASGNTPIGTDPKILIPKINLEVPVVYGLETNDENAVQSALENGVVHYAGTPVAGEQGNTVIVGHSSNNILNKGKYKFAFVLLNKMEVDDLIYLHRDGVRYTYKVYENRVIPPTEVSVLGAAARPNTVTLITCDPPGTTINRRIVVAEQISPDPNQNTASTVTPIAPTETLPSNAPSLWSRITSWF